MGAKPVQAKLAVIVGDEVGGGCLRCDCWKLFEVRLLEVVEGEAGGGCWR